MTVNSKQIKMKKSHHPYKFHIFSFLSLFALVIFKKIGPPATQFLGIFTPFPFNKGEGLETMCIHLKIYETIFASFCVFPLKHFDVSLDVFTAVC